MPSLFISHSSADKAAALELKARLAAEGYDALFLDFDPERGIPAGQSWERELYSQLRRCGAVVFLASPASVASAWCFAEVSLARSLDRPVFQLSLDGASSLPLLAAEQVVDTREGDTAYVRLWRGLAAAGLRPDDSFAFPTDQPVYPGLRPFQPDEAAVFFGRQQEIDHLVDLLHPTLQRQPGRVVAIVGPSGSGKSSLLNAGLLPRLTRPDSPWLVTPTMVPGRNPTAALARSLAQVYRQLGVHREREDLEAAFDRGDHALREVVGDLLDRAGDRLRLLIVIDQAEELATRTGTQERRAFVSLLRGCLDEDLPLWIVGTVRSEFLSTTPERSGLAEAVDDPVLVEPLSPDRLPEVIEGPAVLADLRFAPGLVQRMVQDTDQGDGLPLLAYTLRELYLRVGPNRTVRQEDYDSLGGVVGALRRRADQVMSELQRRGRADAVLPTLMRLATVEGSGEPTRRRVRRERLDPAEAAIMDAFVDARLLTSRHDPDAGGIVEVAHEALLRQWPPLAEAIERARSRLQMRTELERLADDWRRAQDESYLLRGSRLAAFEEWAGVATDLEPHEQQFLAASRELAQREQLRLKRSVRRLRSTVAGLVAFLLVATVSTVVAVRTEQLTRAQARVTLAERLGLEAASIAPKEPDTGVLVGLEALRAAASDADRPPPSAGLITGLALLDHANKLINGHTGQVHAVAYRPDGAVLATGGWDATVRFWDSRTYAPVGAVIRSPSPVNSLAYSRSGRLLVTGGQDGVVRIWDASTRRPTGVTMKTGSWIFSVAFSPDGSLVAAGSDDGAVGVWNVTSGKSLFGRPIGRVGASVTRVAFNPTGTVLAASVWTDENTGRVHLWRIPSGAPLRRPLTVNGTGRALAFRPGDGLLAVADGRSVRLWNPDTGRPVGRPFTGSTDDIWCIAFSPDGRTMATGSVDRQVRLWDVTTQTARGTPLVGHTSQVQDVAFSPDGGSVASASWDTTVRVWQVAESPSVSRALTGHSGAVNGIAFSPTAGLVATSGIDDTVRLWNLPGGSPHGAPLRRDTYPQRIAFTRDGRLMATAAAEGGTVTIWDVVTARPRVTIHVPDAPVVQDVAFSPDGTMIATGDDATNLRFWRVPSGVPIGGPLPNIEVINAVAFSPDGRLVATGMADRTVRLWDVATRAPVRVLEGHTDQVWSVAFSPDGRRLVSAGDDRTIRQWDVASGRPLGQPILAHEDVVWRAVYSPDGARIASASGDGTAKLWRTSDGMQVGSDLTAREGPLNNVAFSPDGRTLGTVGDRGVVRLWNLTFQDWWSTGCQLVGHNLSMTQWQQFLPGEPYHRTCPDLPPG